VELFPLPQGGLLADSPGFNQPELTCDIDELPRYFPEIRQRLGNGSPTPEGASRPCQFNNCRHLEEPNCSVRGHWERYDIYRQFCAEVEARMAERSREPSSSSSLKQKMGHQGRVRYEPVLAPEKFRRESRKANRQALRDYTAVWEEGTSRLEDELE
jgi:ribosome biogenesis GTPase